MTLANIELIPNETKQTLLDEYAKIAGMLQQIIKQLGYPFMRLNQEYDNVSWVSARLTELLPLRLVEKQFCLELNDPIKRLEHISMLIKDI